MRALLSFCLSYSARSREWRGPKDSQPRRASLLPAFKPMHSFNFGLSIDRFTRHVRLLGSSVAPRKIAPTVAFAKGKMVQSRGQRRGSASKDTSRTAPPVLSRIYKPTSAPRVLIVGTGLTGSLTCFHLRALFQERIVIDVKDMARGAGGRMSTTRRGPAGMKANTGAQYLSYFSLEAAELLKNVSSVNDTTHECPIDHVVNPLKRSTHFLLKSHEEYEHALPRYGTNSAVKQFLYGGAPDEVAFESRLQKIVIAESGGKLLPLFDRGSASDISYDVVILAMPPKDILKFFSDRSQDHDQQSQADLHRRTNRGRAAPVPPGHRPVALPSEVTRRLRSPIYIGRYSLALWFRDMEFIRKVWSAWNKLQTPHEIIDAISHQQNVLVTQSTVKFWQRASGRERARAALDAALEDLAGGKMPRTQHAKLLNWRTSQVQRPLVRDVGSNARHCTDAGVVTAERGRLIFTGDWCAESSFEGCNLAATKAANAARDAISRIWGDA